MLFSVAVLPSRAEEYRNEHSVVEGTSGPVLARREQAEWMETFGVVLGVPGAGKESIGGFWLKKRVLCQACVKGMPGVFVWELDGGAIEGAGPNALELVLKGTAMRERNPEGSDDVPVAFARRPVALWVSIRAEYATSDYTGISMRFAMILGFIAASWIAAVQARPKQAVTEQKKNLNTNETKQKEKVVSQPIADQLIDRILAAQTAKSNEDTEMQRKLAKYTRWLVIVGAVQFFALIAQGVVFLLTLRSMRDTAQRQLRAYIYVPSALLKFHKPDIPEVQVHLKNSGQTPAYDVTGWIHMWIEDYPLRVALPEPPEGFQRSREVMGPGAERVFVNLRDVPIAGRPLSLLGTPKGTIYAYGEVRYKDAFGVERYTKYRFMNGGSEGVRKSKPDAEGVVTALLKPDTDGNEAN